MASLGGVWTHKMNHTHQLSHYHTAPPPPPTRPLNDLVHPQLSLTHPLNRDSRLRNVKRIRYVTHWLVVTLVVVTLPAISLAILTPPQDVTITKIPQGISTYSGDFIYALKAEWTVLLLLQNPTGNPRMLSIL